MRNSQIVALLACAMAFVAVAQNTDPISVLKSDASREQKSQAFIALSRQAGVDAIPVLAPMLLDPDMSHMARYVLEPMPSPEAGAALRDALGKTTGRLQVGMISSLAMRKDTEAVPALIKLLGDPDLDVANEAARSLGMINPPEAVKALTDALGAADVPAGKVATLCEGLLRCAEQLAAQGKGGEAAAVYDHLRRVSNAPGWARAGALRGTVLSRGADGLAVLTDTLRGEDEVLFDAALRTSREMQGGDEVAAAVAGVVSALPAERKIKLMQALGERKNEAAGPALMAEAKEGPTEVRVAALLAMTRIGYAPAVDYAAGLVADADADLAKAARDSVAYFPGKAGDAALNAMLASNAAETRRVAVELIGEGGLHDAVGLLMSVAAKDADENVRIAALKALQDSAGVDEAAGLVASLLAGKSPQEMQTAEKTLQALSGRSKRNVTGRIVIKSAKYGALPGGPSANVTEKVAQLVELGSMSIDASNGNFGDTAPGLVKKLKVDYTHDGVEFSKTVGEGETMSLAVAAAPAPVVDAFLQAFETSGGEARLALVRLLGTTGSSKALDAVRKTALGGDAAVVGQALRTLCDWPTPEALPMVMELVQSPPDATVKVLAMRGAARMIEQTPGAPAERLAQYGVLMAQAAGADEKKLVIGSLAQVHDVGALEMVLRQLTDETVKAEALQAAFAIAKGLGKAAREETAFFNGKDLTGWQGNDPYWSVEDGAIVGQSKKKITQNEFVWSGVEVGDFYLAVDVKIEPKSANAGVQFRSKKVDEHGQALGYQADAGEEVWGRLYHEHGRGKLDWNDRGGQAVKPDDWNHYEILAVGPAIWTAINGKLAVSCLDLDGERSGLIAAQIHGGPPMTAQYRFQKLIHNPKVEFQGITAETLIQELKPPDKQ